MELSTLNLPELLALQDELEHAIKQREQEEKAIGRKKMLALAREYGLSLEEILDTGARKERTPVATKYANPANPSQTWTGRGRNPLWVTQALHAGKTLEDLVI